MAAVDIEMVKHLISTQAAADPEKLLVLETKMGKQAALIATLEAQLRRAEAAPSNGTLSKDLIEIARNKREAVGLSPVRAGV